MTRTALTALTALIALAGCTGSGLDPNDAVVAVEAGAIIEGEFIIDADLDENVRTDLGLQQLDFDEVLSAGLYRADDGVTRSALEALLKDRTTSEVAVENNRAISALANDPYRSLQWNLDLLDIDTAWSTSTGAGAVVAVIDSGVSWSGEDTPLNLVAGWDYVDGDGDPTDENGHGTHVAGTIAQATDNGLGVAGVAPDATVLAIRVLDQSGSGSVYWSAKGIRYAVDNGADVINLSLGSPWSSAVEEDAVDYAVDNGVVVVAASGNDGKSSLDYPAAYNNVISVGAVGADGAVVNYSNGGTGLDVVAPGGDMGADRNGDGYADGVLQETLDWNGTSYQFFEGTSMATPHVAAVAALLISAGAESWEVRGLLTDTAVDLSSGGWDTWSGYGLIDPVAALAQVSGDSEPPSSGGETTEPEPEPGTSDTTAPVVSNVSADRNGSSMTLYWTTDEPTTTELEFDDYGWFGDTSTLSTDHELGFYIDPSVTYYFTITATDAAGNTTEDGVWAVYP